MAENSRNTVSGVLPNKGPGDKEDIREISFTNVQDYKKKRTGGLKLSLRLFATAAVVVLVVNASWCIWAWKRYGVIPGDGGPLGFGSVYEGNCDRANTIDTWLHLLINTLSTVLLLASNCFMQAISSPNRDEVQIAHSQRKWLHIGVLSLRNLRLISTRKAILCLLLALTSIPFHLLYNSMILTSTSANMYHWAIVTPGFLQGRTFNVTDRYLPHPTHIDTRTIEAVKRLQDQVNTYERIDNAACVSSYSNSLSSSRRNVVLVSEPRNATTINGNNVSIIYDAFETYTGSLYNWDVVNDGLGTELWNSWLCPSLASNIALCDPESIFPNGDGLEVSGFPITYCLSEQIEATCSVRFSWAIMISIIACNVVKVVAMAYMAYRFEAEDLIASIGDAIASFLLVGDPTTSDLYPTTYRGVRRSWKRGHNRWRPNEKRPGRCAQAVSLSRWLFFSIFLCLIMGFVVILLIWGVNYLNSETISPWSLGFGKINSSALVWADPNTPSIVVLALIGNSPQLVLSVMYLSYNGLMTAMFLARDWNAFGYKAQTLMTSNPAGKQRDTWLLGVPLIPGVLIFVFQVLMHWLVSQSLFVISIQLYYPDGTLSAYRVDNLAYSPYAICASLIAAAVLLFSPCLIGLWKLKAVEPCIASTCSVAISAACHIARNPKGNRLVYEALTWGEDRDYTVPGRSSFVPVKSADSESSEKPKSVIQKIFLAIGGAGLFVYGLFFG